MRADGLTTPHPSRFPPERADYGAAMEAHARAVAAGHPGYIDPLTGLYVMTAVNLAERGSCCDRGCRHCPYLGESAGSEPCQNIEQSEERQ